MGKKPVEEDLSGLQFDFSSFAEASDDDIADMMSGVDKRKKAEKPKTVAEAQEVISAVLKKFKDQAKNEQKVFTENVDSEYWIAICFQSREQKEEWLRQAGLIELGDKYLDGLEVAEVMGMDIKKLTPPIRKVKISKSWTDFVKK